MSKLGPYFVQFRSMRNDLTGLPAWARFIFIAVALPGIALVALSFLAVAVSIVVLLLLTVPVYVFLRAITRTGGGSQMTTIVQVGEPGLRESKHVDAKVRDADQSAPDEVNGE
jgi:hypothetical protein